MVVNSGNSWSVTNLGAILFARNLELFKKKSYTGNNL
jgi:hypothetical protein